MGTLKMCQQAQDQLQNAINTVVKAEQQLRENTREVRNVNLFYSSVFVERSVFFFPSMSIFNLKWPEPAPEERCYPRFVCLWRKNKLKLNR